ncbi:glutamine synthetase family protein [Candidatus Poriferisodalis sp.]|uniref:glutamine synthetase family protein n=1 Tax=Candidatus Poriferisodalis sp. TaxID=3101277 RepID=UPI003B51FC5F
MTTLAEIESTLRGSDVHTVEVAIVDTYGHLRGKRFPVDHFLASAAENGCHLADAIYIFDLHNDLVDSPYINMAKGFLDTHLVPDLGTLRLFGHRPGYALVFSDSLDPSHKLHPIAPRTVLARQIERCEALGYGPVVATEMEFYLCEADWSHVQSHIQYSSLTDRGDLETVLLAMRLAMIDAGIPVESSNSEYGPGQIEINVAHADAMTTADNTALYKSIVKEIAEETGLKATFMPKPWTEPSGSGMHVHTSLSSGGENVFASSQDAPNKTMAQWLGGQLDNALALSLLGSPVPNGYKRVRPYTFAPTHVHWGLDNRSVMCRCTVGAGNANRVEYRAPGADANPYLMIAGLLAAGADGLERSADPGPKSEGDKYDDPGDAIPLPANAADGIAAYEGSALSAALGEEFSTNFLLMATAELEKFLEAGCDPAGDDVSDWERERYIEFT